MFTYYYRIYDKLGKEVTALLILNYKLETKVDKYNHKFMNTSVNYQYQVFDLIKAVENKEYDQKNIFAFIIEAAYIESTYKNDAALKYSTKRALITKLFKEKIITKEKLNLLLNFIQQYVSLHNEELDDKIEELVISKQKLNKNMGLQELFQTHLEKVEKKTLKKGVNIGIEKGVNIGIEKGVNIGMEKGVNIGIEKGVNIGIEKGIEKKNIEVVMSMYANDVPLSKIALFSNIGLNKVKQIIRENK